MIIRLPINCETQLVPQKKAPQTRRLFHIIRFTDYFSMSLYS